MMFRPVVRCCSYINRPFPMSNCQKREPLAWLLTRNASDSGSHIVEKQTEQQATLTKTPKPNYPIAKNFFLGKVDQETIVFPETLNKDELDELNGLLHTVEAFFDGEVDSKAIDEAASIPQHILKALKELGLFGQQIPREYGGLALNAVKCTRVAEVTGLDRSIAVTLAAHQSMGLKGILLFGTEEQKQKYLPMLASGEYIAALAMTELSSGSDVSTIETTATLSPEGTHYILNGDKIWISNGGIADVFTVLAKIHSVSPTGAAKEELTAFIVEKTFGGVTSGQSHDKLGIRGSNTCDVHFDNTPVPRENILGLIGNGFKVAREILSCDRFSMGSSVAASQKKLLAAAAEHAISRRQFNSPLMDFGLIQMKVVQVALRCYVMESMAYLTAGMQDEYEQDVSMESAIVKVYSSEAAWASINDCMDIFGGKSYMKDYPYELHLRDSRSLLIFEGTNEILRLFISLTGIQSAAEDLAEFAQKASRPIANFGTYIKLRMERNSRLKSRIMVNNLHNSLQESADKFEQRLVEFHNMVNFVTSAHGNNLQKNQMTLKRVADIEIDLYGMFAVLVRSSRSLSIGLKNADLEQLLAQTFVYEACTRIDKLIEDLKGGITNGDLAYEKIAKNIFKNHGYPIAHPLERNW